MDLITYAVSDRLSRNGELLSYMNQDAIPKAVVEKAFEELIKNYNDKGATKLVENYKEFLSEHVGVAITPKGDGLHVRGEINDNVLDIIQMVHGQKSETVVEDLVRDTIKAINPDRDVTITKISLADKLVRLKESISNTNAIVEHIDGIGRVVFTDEPKAEVKSESKVDDVHEELIQEVPELDLEQDITLDIAPEIPEAIVEHEPLENPIKAGISQIVADTKEDHVAHVTPKVEPKAEVNAEQKAEDEERVQGILKSTWKNFMQDLVARDLVRGLEMDEAALTAAV